MKHARWLVVLAIAGYAGLAFGGAEIGAAAPAWTLTDTGGQTHSLSNFLGKTLVLEWTNPDCPFVKKHYGGKNMQSLQQKYTAKGVVWLSVCSSAEGKQGHYDAAAWQQKIKANASKATAVLLDADGVAGRAYEAKTTPHMFIVDAEGKLAYRGAIDSNRSWDPKTIEGATNYVSETLDALLGGKPVTTTETKPYGCSVKY